MTDKITLTDDAALIEKISPSELINRAIRNAISRREKHRAHPRWVAVMSVFACGSSYARAICKVHGYDPDALVNR